MLSRYSLYRRLLQLYPPAYRQKYGDQMVQTLADMLDDQPNEFSRSLVWARAFIDLPISLVHQNILYIGGSMTNQTPQYVKRNALISSVLLVPFFVILLSRTLQHNSTPAAAVWQSSLYIGLVGLPLLAFVLATATFIRWTRDGKRPFWKSVFDIRRNWVITFVAGLALLISLFVPFHDSTHCVTGNPLHEIEHAQQTWQCIWNSK